MCNILQPVAK